MRMEGIPRWLVRGEALMVTLPVKQVSVITGRGTDKVCITLDDDKFAFPTMQYETSANIDVEAGRGVDYVRRVLGIQNPEVVKVSHL